MSAYNGPERRQASNQFEREVIEFMARTDQRNMDRDLAHAIEDEAAVDMDKRMCSVERTITIAKTVVAGVPAFGSVAWACFKLGQYLKDFKFQI